MREEILNWIRCPYCKKGLELDIGLREGCEIKEGGLICRCGKNYIIKDFIPRFIETDLYANSFSLEWGLHSRTQLDSANINNHMRGLSEKAFQNRISFSLSELKDKLVLDAGCGMGRYAEIAMKYGATVIGIDMSFAIDYAYKNIGRDERVHLAQADIFRPPFDKETFDFIYSFGVLHHTPDCNTAFKQISRLLKKESSISIFVYSSYNKGIMYASDAIRKITTRIPKRLLYYFCCISIPLYYIYKLPIIGNILKMIFVISIVPHWKWRWLDTFDWYSPRYQSKHTHAEAFGWFKEAGLKDIEIFDGEITMMGTKRD